MSQYLTTKELSSKYPALFTESFLKKSRMVGSEINGPRYFKRGSRLFYHIDDVESFISDLKSSADNDATRRKSLSRSRRPRGR